MDISRVAVRAGVLAAALALAAAGSAAATTPTPASGAVPGVASIGGGGGTIPALQVFYRSTGAQLITKVGGSTENLGGALTSGPAAVTSAATEFLSLEVFVRGTDNGIWSRSYSDGLGEWTGWRNQGGRALGAPGATCVGAPESATRLYVRGTDNALWRKVGGGAWTRLGGVLTSDPAPIPSAGLGCASTEIVYARGGDNAIWQWTSAGWTRVGGVATAAPAVLQLRNSEVDVFARGTDNRLWMARRLPGSATFGAFARVVDLPLTSAPTATRHVTAAGAESRRVFFQSGGGLVGAANPAAGGGWSVAPVG